MIFMDSKSLDFNLQEISQYRTQLMGISALMIIICHSLLAPGILVENPLFRWVIIQGNRGVDIFLLVSGIGLYYSLCSHNGSLSKWYSKRYKRILVPYLVTLLPYFFYAVISGRSNITESLMFITSVSYYTDHVGYWFVDMLFVLYLITPFYYKIFTKCKYKISLTAIICIACLLINRIEPNITNQLCDSVLKNVFIMIGKLPPFFIGMLLAPDIKNARMIKVWYLILVPILGVILIKLLMPEQSYWEFLEIFPMIMFFIYLFKLNMVGKIMSFFGKISLESYMANGVMIGPLYLFPATLLPANINYGNYFWYSLVFILGTILAVIIHYISKIIINKL